MGIYEYGILILFGLAISDLIVGVSNDAANFLNSSVGSRVASLVGSAIGSRASARGSQHIANAA